MKFSTFLMLVMLGGIAFLLIRPNPGQSRYAPLTSSTPHGRYENPSATADSAYFEITGRVTRQFHDGRILVSGTISELGKGIVQPGIFAVSGRADTSLLGMGTPIHCEVLSAGTYEFMGNGGQMVSVGQFHAVGSAPGAARAGAWMHEGNPLERGPYKQR